MIATMRREGRESILRWTDRGTKRKVSDESRFRKTRCARRGQQFHGPTLNIGSVYIFGGTLMRCLSDLPLDYEAMRVCPRPRSCSVLLAPRTSQGNSHQGSETISISLVLSSRIECVPYSMPTRSEGHATKSFKRVKASEAPLLRVLGEERTRG